MFSRQQFFPKPQPASLLLSFDFLSDLAVGETISTKVVTSTVYSGTDPNPSAMISGSASVVATLVIQKVTGGFTGNIYDLLCTITTNLGQTIQKAGYLAIVPAL